MLNPDEDNPGYVTGCQLLVRLVPLHQDYLQTQIAFRRVNNGWTRSWKTKNSILFCFVWFTTSTCLRWVPLRILTFLRYLQIYNRNKRIYRYFYDIQRLGKKTFLLLHPLDLLKYLHLPLLFVGTEALSSTGFQHRKSTVKSAVKSEDKSDNIYGLFVTLQMKSYMFLFCINNL